MAVTTLVIKTVFPDAILDTQAQEAAFGTPEGARFLNDGKTRVVIRNSGAGPHVITVATPKVLPGGLTVGDKTFTVAAGKTAQLPYFDPTYFNDSGGYCSMTSDGTQAEVMAVATREK